MPRRRSGLSGTLPFLAAGITDRSMDASIQELLIRFAGTLNRRRAYAATHPIVLAAETQLLAAATTALQSRSTISIGVARHELLVDGAPWASKSGTARELASRLHRRGVGALTFEAGLSLDALQAGLTWLARDPDGATDAAPTLSGLHITRTAYDLLVLDDAIRDAQSAIASLWRVLAELAGVQSEQHDAAGFGGPIPEEFAGLPLLIDDTLSGAEGFDTDAIVTSLRGALGESSVARRTAVALLELTNHGAATTQEGRALIGEQLVSLLERLGDPALTPIITSLAEVSRRQDFVTQMVDVLPITEAVRWLDTAATASEHPLSTQLVRLMGKLSTLAADRADGETDEAFRDAARSLVERWTPADPNPAEHVALLNRIATFERTATGSPGTADAKASAIIESSRLVQMALEMGTMGDDTIAAVEALVASSAGRTLFEWIDAAGTTPTALALRAVATSERTIRHLLLTEPVDRLEARALLDALDPSSTDTLIDVLGEASSKGTRLLVRQRLAEFGDASTPQLIARLDDGPWYLIRNILSLLLESEAQRANAASAADTIDRLLGHEQVQVRLEALRVLIRLGGDLRESALTRALADENERVVVLALQTLSEGGAEGLVVSDAMVTQLLSLASGTRHSEPVRARAVRTLAIARSDSVRSWLINHVTRRTMVLRRLALVEPSPTTVSALHVLTRVYASDPAAADVVALAHTVSGDPRWQVRDTAPSVERSA